MTIRHMTTDDLDWLVDKAIHFNAAHYHTPLNLDKTRRILWQLLDSDLGVCIRDDTGAIVGTIEEDPFRDYVFLVERGWFSTGRGGIRLLRAFTEYGKECGVDEIRMSTLATNDGVNAIVLRHGYTPAEHSFRLRLGGNTHGSDH